MGKNSGKLTEKKPGPMRPAEKSMGRTVAVEKRERGGGETVSFPPLLPPSFRVEKCGWEFADCSRKLPEIVAWLRQSFTGTMWQKVVERDARLPPPPWPSRPKTKGEGRRSRKHTQNFCHALPPTLLHPPPSWRQSIQQQLSGRKSPPLHPILF